MSTPSGLDDLLTLLRFPSVSTNPANAGDVRACASWLMSKLRSIGLSAEMRETAGHPVVLARNVHQADRRTVMIYAHYDVQPAEPLNEWLSPAFEPTIRDGRIYCRGATDNKGQLMAHLRGLEETMTAHGDLPVNLIFLIEGEEEIGSPHLKAFLEQHREELKCDVVAISDTGMVGPGLGTFTYGLRGIACMEVRVKGPTIDLHSGIFGGAVMNPNTAVARLAATLHDEDGRVAISGFYDEVRPLEAWEREAWQQLGDSSAETLALTGSP
ncbi:MAG: Peptidase, partial [Verrucomicrobiaceae bacterium]|nr:Peptidase [Verrucomicrobiaceae bacterium]